MISRIFSLTIAGSVPLLLLLATETLFPRVWTWRWRYYARLVSVFAFLMPIVKPVILTQPSYEQPIFWEQPVGMLHDISNTLAVTPQSPSVLPKVLLAVWLAGVIAFVLYRLAAWLRFCTVVRRASMPVGESEYAVLEQCPAALRIKRRVHLLICPSIGSPALAGILRPTILLPHCGIPAHELQFILYHELTHLRRGDIAYKLAVQLVCALHWFNPLAWALSHQVGELCELSCDEATVRGWSSSERKQYGNAILSQIANTRYGLPQIVPGFSAAKQILMKRLNVIMNIRRPSKGHAILGVLTALVLAGTGTMTSLALAPTNERAVVVISPAEWGVQSSHMFRMESAIFERSSSMAKENETERLLPPKDAETEKSASDSISEASEAENLSSDSIAKSSEAEGLLPAKETEATKLAPSKSMYMVKDEMLVEVNDVPAPELPKLIAPIAATVEKQFTTVGFMGYNGHLGMDFAAPMGTEILAAADGIVLQAKIHSGAYGNLVNIDHGNGVYSLYTQCQKLLVAEGGSVKQGQVIATVGMTGRATGPHLHFELRSGEYWLNPEQYITR